VSTSHSGWFWSSPQPQGEPLHDVSFAGGAGYAVGDFGTVLRTADGGATWTDLPTGLFGNLTHVDAVSAGTVIVAGGCVLRRSDDGGSTFVRLPWTASDSFCPQPIMAIDFPTADTGYLLLTGGTILRTEDGGQSWARAANQPPSSLAAIVFSSPTRGIAAGSGIYLTTDGGSTWTAVDDSVNLVSAVALDGVTGMVAFAQFGVRPGSAVPGPGFYTSADGGQTWTAAASAAAYAFAIAGTRLDCASGSGCLLSGGGGVFRTTDGASLQNVTPVGLSVNAAAFAGPTQAVAVTQQGTPALSGNGGATFSGTAASLAGGFHGLRVSSDSLATLSGPSGELALTSDGGRTWAVLDTPSSNLIDDTSFVSSSTGFALDSTGAVLRTDNSGSSWQTLTAQAGEDTLVALDSEHVLLVGPKGIERSADGGKTFTSVLGGATVDRLAPAGTAIVAAGPRHAYMSSNGGSSWRGIALPRGFLRGESIRQIEFTTTPAGFLLGTGGRLFGTVDGGRRWSEVLGLAHAAIQSIAFTSARTGWAAEGNAGGTPGEVLRTSDGGKSWRPQRVSATQIDELGAGGQAGYAQDEGGDVFVTGTAGDLGGASAISLKAPRRGTRQGRVTVTGRLLPRLAGASVEVSYRALVDRRWVHDYVSTRADGGFSLTARIRRRTAFVAQWAGDLTSRGAGSRAAIVAP
jgi:photosystem II stability/assembly factor-like uncharacterized protein